MRRRHETGEEFGHIKARLAESFELDPLQMEAGMEFLRLAERLAQLLQEERDLNDRLAAFAMGMQEAGVIGSDDLNVLMGLS
jgi:hypothetical protein